MRPIHYLLAAGAAAMLLAGGSSKAPAKAKTETANPAFIVVQIAYYKEKCGEVPRIIQIMQNAMMKSKLKKNQDTDALVDVALQVNAFGGEAKWCEYLRGVYADADKIGKQHGIGN